jgi:HEAT repeat protein
MRGVTLILLAAGFMLAVGVLTVLAWFVYTTYLERVERRLAARKGLYRELVSGLAARDRALLEPTIHQMRTLYDLDALEAVLEEQARNTTGRPAWLLEVYDQLGLVDKYIDKLRTARKWRDRAFAAELLGRVGTAKAVPALLETVQATQTEDSDVREIALRALARIADPGAVRPLVAALAAADVWLAPRIADILTRHGDSAVDPLIALLGDSSPHPARAWAANVLGEVRAQRAFPALVRGLDDREDEVRAKSATALGRLGDPRAVSHLLDHMLSDPAPFVRTRIACTLGQFDGPEVIDRLVRALGDPAWWVRMRGVEALEQIGGAAEGPLLVALDDPDPEIRSRAAVALERLAIPPKLVQMIESGEGAPEATQTLVRLAAAGTRELIPDLLLSPSPRVREVVLTAIRQASRQDLGAELIQLASSDPEPALRALALEALRDLRVHQALPIAIAGLDHADPGVRAASIHLIGELGSAEAVELLRQSTTDPEPAVRAATARALGAWGAGGVQDDLRHLMADPDATVREAAVMGAADARLRTLVPSLMDLLADSSDPVRLSAGRAISLLGDRSTVPVLVRSFDGAAPDAREAIILAVGRLDPAALSGLLDTLARNRDARSKLTLARMLGRLRPQNAVDVLEQLIGDADPSVRAAALEALGRCVRFAGPVSELVGRAVAEGLRDPDAPVRASAIDLCSRICLHDQAGSLMSLLQSDPSPLVRERAALAIASMRAPGAEEALIAACRPSEPANLRAAAALGAGVFDRDSLVSLMEEMPDDQSVRELLRERLKSDAWFRLLSRRLPRGRSLELHAVAAADAGEAQQSLADGIRSILDSGERVRLIRGLRTFQGEQSRGVLLRIVRGDPSPEVRTAAMMAVAEMLDPDELLAFGSRALGDPSIMVRRAALDLFARAPSSRVFPRLLQALRLDDDAAVFSAAAGVAEENFPAFRDAALALPLQDTRAILVARLSRYIHHSEIPELLRRLSQSTAPEVREAVAEVWRYRPETVDPVALEALSADPVTPVRHTAAGAAAAAERYDLLNRMTQDPDAGVRREVAIALAREAPVGKTGLHVLQRLEGDPEMRVRAAAYIARLLQGVPVPLPPGLDPRVAAEAVGDAADIPSLRSIARTAAAEDRRLAAALALALAQDEVAREVARTDPAPAIRHRVGGALELSMSNVAGKSS